jgi:hypothetical protein
MENVIDDAFDRAHAYLAVTDALEEYEKAENVFKERTDALGKARLDFLIRQTDGVVKLIKTGEKTSFIFEIPPGMNNDWLLSNFCTHLRRKCGAPYNIEVDIESHESPIAKGYFRDVVRVNASVR